MYTPSSTAFLRPTRGGGFEYVEYDNNAFPYPQTIGNTAQSISGLGPADETMMKTIFIMPNKSTNPDATLMIVVDEKEPSTDPKTYQYVYVGNINDLPSDVLTEGSIVNDLTSGGTDKPLSAEQGRTLNSHVNYTTCGSNAADQVKLISDDGFELSTHLRLLVKMNNTNTNSTPKFNINNTGVKDVWYNGAVASDTNTWASGEVLDVYYDGGKYITNTHGGAQFSTGEKVGDVGIDNEPTAGSDNLVKSGGVFYKNNRDEFLYDSVLSLTSKTIISTSLLVNTGIIKSDGTTHSELSNYGYSEPIQVKPGDRICMTNVGTNFPFYITCDSSGNFLYTGPIAESITSVLDETFTDTRYLRINGRVNNSSYPENVVKGFILFSDDSITKLRKDVTEVPSTTNKVLTEGFDVVNEYTIKLTAIRIMFNNGHDSGIIYANENHTQQTYEFGIGNGNNLILRDNTILMIQGFNNLQGNDLLLLSFNRPEHICASGELYAEFVEKYTNSKIMSIDEVNNLTINNNIKLHSVPFEKELIGNGQAWKAVRFHIPSNKKYRIHILNTQYADSEVIDYYAKLVIRTITGETLDTPFVEVLKGHTINNYYDILMPPTTNYLQILIRANVGEVIPFYIEDLSNVTSSLTHKLPDNEGQLNAVKRARQMTDIEWTPSFDVPKLDYIGGDIEAHYASTDLGYYIGDYFKAGKKYKGIPYARADKDALQWGYNTFKVGIYIDFETFITAIMNKNSVINKESEGNVSTHNACFYATVCSAMVCAALGLDYYSTASFPSIPGMTSLGLVSSFTLENLKLGDVLVETSIHTAIVTDIIIEDGLVKFVEVSEATPTGNDNNNSVSIGEEGGEYGGVCRRKWWSRTKFLTNWDIYTILRYSLIGNVTYTPSPYVQIGDEVEQPANHIMSLMPYMGNKFTYYVGKIVNNDILINATGFTKLRVIKDGVAWNENGTSDYYDITGLSKISIGFTEVGNYTAYLCNVSSGVEIKKSKSCTWAVRN